MATLTLTRTLNASQEDVYNALTQVEHLKNWFSPEGMDMTEVVFEPTVGSDYRLGMTNPEGKVHTAVGKVTEANPHTRLSYTWTWEGTPMPESNVLFELKDVDGKTELTLTHSELPNEESVEQHNQGWSSSMGKLEKLVA